MILGGIEASMRRLTHYDYWSDSVKPGILSWSGADMLVYGMGEKSIVRIANHLSAGNSLNELHDVEQTAYRLSDVSALASVEGWETLVLPAHESCLKDKKEFS